MEKPSLALAPALLALLFGLSACSSGPANGSTSGDTTTNDTTGQGGDGGGTDGGGGAGGSDIPPAPKIVTISGDATWQVTFDATAQAAGATDCSYTRHYEGVEDRSAPWLCPECEIMFRTTVELTEGLNDCYSQVTSSPPAEQEWLGYGKGQWWRTAGGLMSAQGMTAVTETDVSWTHSVMDVEAPPGGTLSFSITGSVKLGEIEGDVLNGFVAAETYSCGWPKANPPEYTGPYTLTKGATVPDGVFKDKCNEMVRIHDFKGSYIVIDMSAIDCPACNVMASEEEQMVADLKAQGVEVHFITLMAPSLSNPIGNTSVAQLNAWTNKYNLTSPVLADRVWGISMFYPLFTDQLGYPSWAIVDPDLNVVDYGVGYDGPTIENIILADAN